MQEDTAHPGVAVCLGLILIGFFFAGVSSVFAIQLFSSVRLFLGEVMIIVPALYYLHRKKYDLKQVFRIHKIDRATVIVTILLGISVSILMDELDRIIGLFIKVPSELEKLFSDILKAESPLEFLLLFLAAVIAAAVIEEMLFRGLLLKSLESRFEVPHAIFFSALAFAFLHLMPWLLQILILGLILGFLAWRSNSILPGIILHAANNAFALVFLNSTPETFQWYNWHSHVYPPILVVASAITYYGFKGFYRLTEREDPSSPIVGQ
ncbi:MAG: lysostaphin resistance A-like protein [bacterium]